MRPILGQFEAGNKASLKAASDTMKRLPAMESDNAVAYEIEVAPQH
jgi:hypothetical protein